MKRNSHLPGIIPLFLIFILLINLSGCYVFKPVPRSDLAKYKTENYHFVIKGKGVPFLLENPGISNGLLWGTANPEATFTHKDLIRIYPSPDYEIDVTDKLNTVRIPIDRIAKVQKSQFSILYTVSNLLFLILLFSF